MLTRIFRRKTTVDTITKSLARMSDRLQNHAASHDAHAVNTEALIYDLSAKRRAHESEAVKARAVAANIAALLA